MLSNFGTDVVHEVYSFKLFSRCIKVFFFKRCNFGGSLTLNIDAEDDLMLFMTKFIFKLILLFWSSKC